MTTPKDPRDALPHPMQPVGYDGDGVVRFKPNAIVRRLVDLAAERLRWTLNEIVVEYHHGRFSRADLVQLYQLLGYSVSGFGDLSEVPRDVVAAADDAAEAVVNGTAPTPGPSDYARGYAAGVAVAARLASEAAAAIRALDPTQSEGSNDDG